MTRRAVGLVLGALVAFGVLWLWPRGPKDPEAQVRALVAGIVAATEKRDLGPLSDAIADDFKGPEGAGKAEVKQIVMFQVLRNQETVAIFNPSLDVTIETPDDAKLEGLFLFSRSKAKSVEELQPEMVASVYRISAKLERRGGDWKLVRATYQQASWP